MSLDKPLSSTELLSAYTAGTLDRAFALLLQTQAALRSDLRYDMAVSESLVGAQLELERPYALSDDAAERALAAIDALEADGLERKAAEIAGRHLADLKDLPQPLHDAALGALAEGGGWRGLSPGVRRLTLDLDSDATAEVYRIAPGASTPRHSHENYEYTLCVSGGFHDGRASYGPGEMAVNGPDDTHRPVADDDAPCVVLAVRGGGLRFTGVMGVVQRVFRG